MPTRNDLDKTRLQRALVHRILPRPHHQSKLGDGDPQASLALAVAPTRCYSMKTNAAPATPCSCLQFEALQQFETKNVRPHKQCWKLILSIKPSSRELRMQQPAAPSEKKRATRQAKHQQPIQQDPQQCGSCALSVRANCPDTFQVQFSLLWHRHFRQPNGRCKLLRKAHLFASTSIAPRQAHPFLGRFPTPPIPEVHLQVDSSLDLCERRNISGPGPTKRHDDRQFLRLPGRDGAKSNMFSPDRSHEFQSPLTRVFHRHTSS